MSILPRLHTICIILHSPSAQSRCTTTPTSRTGQSLFHSVQYLFTAWKHACAQLRIFFSTICVRLLNSLLPFLQARQLDDEDQDVHYDKYGDCGDECQA
jgi:hypothetical protein